MCAPCGEPKAPSLLAAALKKLPQGFEFFFSSHFSFQQRKVLFLVCLWETRLSPAALLSLPASVRCDMEPLRGCPQVRVPLRGFPRNPVPPMVPGMEDWKAQSRSSDVPRGGSKVMEGQLDTVSATPASGAAGKIRLAGREGARSGRAPAEPAPSRAPALVALFQALWGSGFALVYRARGCPPGRAGAGRFSSAGRWPKGPARCRRGLRSSSQTEQKINANWP